MRTAETGRYLGASTGQATKVTSPALFAMSGECPGEASSPLRNRRVAERCVLLRRPPCLIGRKDAAPGIRHVPSTAAGMATRPRSRTKRPWRHGMEAATKKPRACSERRQRKATVRSPSSQATVERNRNTHTHTHTHGERAERDRDHAWGSRDVHLMRALWGSLIRHAWYSPCPLAL